MPMVKIDTATSGANPLVTADPDCVIRVLNYFMVSAGSVTVKFQGAAVDLTGAMSMVVGVPLSFSGDSGRNSVEGAVQTAKNQALNLNLSANVQVSGHLFYEYAAPTS